jgi:PAS domain S-box-containing protein
MKNKAKKKEQLIKETKEKYEALIKNIPEAIYSVLPDETGTTTFMSPKWKDWTGYAPEDFYKDHETWPKSIHPEDRDKAVQAYIEAIKMKREYILEYRVIHKETGVIRYLRDHGIPTKDENGKVIRIDGIVTDITERKQLEDNLKLARQRLEEKVEMRTAELKAANEKLRKKINEHMQTEEALKKSEAKYHNLIEHANDAIISVNAAGVIMGFNKRAEEMFGYSREEILGKSSALLVAKQNREKQKMELQKLEEAGAEFNKDQNIFEGIGVRKDGKEFNVEFSFYIVEVNGAIIATSSVRDISERKLAEQKLIDYQKRLKALTSQLTLSEEKERRHFAEYLHDEIGQYLFASQLQLEQLKTALASTENATTLDKVLSNIKQVIDNSRSLTFELSSPILYELGLEKALEWLVEHTTSSIVLWLPMKTINRKNH